MVEGRIVIKDRLSGLFYVGLDQWTAAEQKALTFQTFEEAAQVITRAELKNVQVIRKN